MALLAILASAFLFLLFFVENTKERNAQKNSDMRNMIRSMYDVVKEYKMLLLIPATVNSALLQVMLLTEYTQVRKSYYYNYIHVGHCEDIDY